ncbi:MAG: thioredoxin family protein [Thermoflexales bacterium]|nr:thioredoxin family protein [Thermoflexales bacterium]MDW8054029.1 thioredoxin family protein [Anaerolineae bacterium]MDW8293117.1 thioredoxin family protein [Anaerolineae bacterium]
MPTIAGPNLKLPLGSKAPAFELLDTVSGKYLSLDQLKSDKATVVMFICNHCPYVKHVDKALVQLAKDYMPKGVAFIAISSNDPVQYPEDSPERMREEAQRVGYPFPYLFDETQEVARAYGAECTPDTFIFDGEMRLVYRGQLDDTRPNSGKEATAADVRAALDAILAGQPVNPVQKPSVGCSIKWRNN